MFDTHVHCEFSCDSQLTMKQIQAVQVEAAKKMLLDNIDPSTAKQEAKAIAANAANVMDLQSDTTIPRTLKPEALDMIAWRLLKRFAVMVSEDRDKANTAARERLEAVRAGTHRVIGPDGRMPVPPGKRPYVQGPRPAYGSGAPGLFPSPGRGVNR